MLSFCSPARLAQGADSPANTGPLPVCFSTQIPLYQAVFLPKVRVTPSGVVLPWPGTSADVLTGISGLDAGVSFGDSVHLRRTVANSCSDPREPTTLSIGLLASDPRASEAQMQSGNSG